jgi:hypothetical protein
MITYELHTLKNDIHEKEWKLTAAFEDLELGMHDATRLDETNRYAGIRLIEERHNEVTGKTDTKTIFRGGVKFNVAKERSLSGTAGPDRRSVEKNRDHLRKARAAHVDRPGRASSGGMSPVRILVFSLIAGLAAMYVLYEFVPD